MDRGTAMLAVVLDVYEGDKDLIPDWKLKEHAESALATGGVEGLRRYYEARHDLSARRLHGGAIHAESKSLAVRATHLRSSLDAPQLT